MNKLVKCFTLALTSFLLTACPFTAHSSEYDPKERDDWGLEIKYAGSYEIRDEYDLGLEETIEDVLFVKAYIVNERDEEIKYIDLKKIDFKVNTRDKNNQVVASSKPGCSSTLHIIPDSKYTFEIGFVDYTKSFFETNPEIAEEDASFFANMKINPIPADNGLLFNLYHAEINDDDGYLYADFVVHNDTGMVVRNIHLNFIKGFQIIGDENVPESYKRVLFANMFQSDWENANLEPNSDTQFTIPLVNLPDEDIVTFDEEYFSQEQVTDFRLVVSYSFN